MAFNGNKLGFFFAVRKVASMVRKTWKEALSKKVNCENVDNEKEKKRV